MGRVGRVRIIDLIDRGSVVSALRVVDKAALLAELADRLATLVRLPPRQVQERLEARERLGSTAIGHGVALPHAWITGVQRNHAVFARLSQPIGSDSTDLVFAMVGPSPRPATTAENPLAALFSVSRTLRSPGLACRLRCARDAQALYDALIAADRAIPPCAPAARAPPIGSAWVRSARHGER